MNTTRRFHFANGVESDQQYLMSYRLDLGETPTIALLFQLFDDLYYQQRLSPHYLFVASQDLTEVSGELRRSCNTFMPAGTRSKNEACAICNPATGNMVNLVALSDLEQGSVIVGFFK